MRVVVTTDRRYVCDSEGSAWTPSNVGRSFYQRYLDVFDGVRVVARVKKVTTRPDGWRRVDGDGVTVHALPHFVGPLGLARRSLQVLRAASESLACDDAVILRGGSSALCLEPLLALTGHPYGLEVVGDPLDVFAPGCVQYPLARFARWGMHQELKWSARTACAVAYVTERQLQKRYPPNPLAFSTHYSSADLPRAAYVAVPRRYHVKPGPFRLTAVGSMVQRYKGFDVLLHAFRKCVAAGLDVTLTLVGDGGHRQELEALAANLSLQERVAFTGELPGDDAVRPVLADSDLFVHPSRAEGLPRVVIEAMAQGLPCIASAVGGTAELLPAEDLVKPGDAEGLASAIRAVIRDPERMTRMSERNLATACAYRWNVLQSRRNLLYDHVRRCTEEYVRGKRGATLHA